MDLLFKRYASPFSFIDGMIQTGRFTEFVEGFVRTINEERNDKAEWEIWLHKVIDKTFDEFREEIKINVENRDMSKSKIETTVTDSLDILNNFTPS